MARRWRWRLALVLGAPALACSEDSDPPGSADSHAGRGGSTSGSPGGGTTGAEPGGGSGGRASGGVPMGGGAGTAGRAGGGAGSAGSGAAGETGEAGAEAMAGEAGTAGAAGSPENPSCAGLDVVEGIDVAGKSCDRIVWMDADCRERSSALVRVGGGYVRQVTYRIDDGTRTITGTGANGHQGWGYAVNHFGDTATVGQDLEGTFGVLFAGRHHVVYEYRSAPRINGADIPLTQHWFFATGRSNPLLATSYDMTGVAPGSLGADIRTPYGDLAWNGDDNADSTVVSGVGWGDRYKFRTTSSPLTMDSTWDYTEPNLIPYVVEWETSSDSEMGAVQTQTYLQHDAGGYWFYPNWGKTSANQQRSDGQAGNMTPTWNWTYQLNQYELCLDEPSCITNTTASHRLAWGANYGALGGADASEFYAAYGDDRQVSGYPYQSHTVAMVLGPYSQEPTANQVREFELVQATELLASRGAVLADLPGGVGREDDVMLEPPGWDARYATWNLAVDSTGGVTATLDTEGLTNPVFVVWGRDEEPERVVLDGVSLTADRDYFLSVDTAGERLWLTLRGSLSGEHALIIE